MVKHKRDQQSIVYLTESNFAYNNVVLLEDNVVDTTSMHCFPLVLGLRYHTTLRTPVHPASHFQADPPIHLVDHQIRLADPQVQSVVHQYPPVVQGKWDRYKSAQTPNPNTLEDKVTDDEPTPPPI
jgi:hypothetical protein